MNKLLAGSFLFSFLVCAAGPARAQVNLVGGLDLRVEKLSSSGIVTVDVLASPEQTLRIWDSSNSWGAATWRVLIIRNGRVESFFQSPLKIFTANTPIYTEIAKGGHVALKLDLNGGDWCGFGHCTRWNERGFGDQQVSFQVGDTIVVVYDVPPTAEARERGVWWGVAAAAATFPQN